MKEINYKEKYNHLVKGKYEGDYEHNRWFKNSLLKAGYEMERKTLDKRLGGNLFKKARKCLELGPGPGTWTKLLLEKNPEASYDLVDISGEMLSLAKANLKDLGRINFYEADFLSFNPTEKYDFFFSSRAFEYLPDKELAVAKISDLLLPGGGGLIVTKMPRYFAYKLKGQKIPEMHLKQIKPGNFLSLLRSKGLTPTKVYSVGATFPFLRQAWLNRLVFTLISLLPWNPFTGVFSESYGIEFTKR